jgi:hypothetical protein
MVEVDASGVVYIAYIGAILGFLLVVANDKKGATVFGGFLFIVSVVYAVAQRDGLTLATGRFVLLALAAIGAVVLGVILIILSGPWLLSKSVWARILGAVLAGGCVLAVAYFLVETFGG